MRILILFATRQGQTGKVATRLSQLLREQGTDVRLVDAQDSTAVDSLDLDSFDLLVFGGSMHAGGIERELVAFINRHEPKIGSMPRSFFLVLLSPATKDPELRERWLADARSRMDDQLNVPFDDVEMIAGALSYSKYSLPVKWVMKRIARKAGGSTDTSRDHEYTDWVQVERYAGSLVAGASKGK